MASLQGSTISGTLSATTFSASSIAITNLSSSNINGSSIGNSQLNANAITNNVIAYAGAVLQTKVIRYDTINSYNGPTDNTYGRTALTDLRLTITPIYANSLIVCEWWIHGEANNHDSGWTVTTNGAGKATGTYAQYNTDVGNNSHSYLLGDTFYDQDTGSTPTNSLLTYYDVPGSTATRYYDPRFGSNDGGSRTYYINRTVGSNGQTNYENGVSFGRITEIKQ
jgi:hypothetical protein